MLEFVLLIFPLTIAGDSLSDETFFKFQINTTFLCVDTWHVIYVSWDRTNFN